MNRTGKLLIFDSWTMGSIHIIRLLDPLAALGIVPMFVHVGSWGDDPGRPARETISGLDVRDISGYHGLDDVLERERPDAVLFLSLDPMLHRAFNRYVRRRGIPTINLYPGLWSAQNYEQLTTDRAEVFSYWRWVAGRTVRALRYAIPVYLAAVSRTGGGAAEVRALAAELGNKAAGRMALRAPLDAAADYICVYNGLDARHAAAKYNPPRDRIVQVGVPDLIKFKGVEPLIGRFTNEASHTLAHVVYVGTGRRGSRLKIADDADYVEHLKATANALAAYGKTLVCKLHYSRAEAIDALRSGSAANVRACGDEDFVEALASSCGAIIEPSTAALVPIVMGKPVFLAQYGRLEGLTYGPALAQYPKARPLTSLDEIGVVAQPMAGGDAETWIREVGGPLPASEMPARVARVIAGAIGVQ